MSELKIADTEALTAQGRFWTILNNKVYDITDFLPEHPGGAEILDEETVKGKDCTDLFNDIGHSLDALKTADKYYVGEYKK